MPGAGLVDDESRAAPLGDLEQHAARLGEVHRAEEVAVDHSGRLDSTVGEHDVPLLDVVGPAPPRDVLDDAATEPPLLDRRGIELVPAPALLAAGLEPLRGDRSKAERSVMNCSLACASVANAWKPSSPCDANVGRDVRRLAGQRLVAGADDGELVVEALVVGEPQR